MGVHNGLLADILDLSDYPFLNTLIIILMILCLAIATAYLFKIKNLSAILFLFALYSLGLVAFGVLDSIYAGAGIIIFAIVATIVFRKKSGGSE